MEIFCRSTCAARRREKNRKWCHHRQQVTQSLNCVQITTGAQLPEACGKYFDGFWKTTKIDCRTTLSWISVGKIGEIHSRRHCYTNTIHILRCTEFISSNLFWIFFHGFSPVVNPVGVYAMIFPLSLSECRSKVDQQSSKKLGSNLSVTKGNAEDENSTLRNSSNSAVDFVHLMKLVCNFVHGEWLHE